jgi:cellulose synthase/poly-beta-1,6-N-acetylglucosamine synthase-like glycosyltransferase
MTPALELCLALSLVWLVYVYAGYPLLLVLLSRLRRVPVGGSNDLPSVSILTAAHNEAAVIGETLANKLALDYPPDRLEILVISDGSTDGTDSIVESLAQRAGGRVRLLRQEPRQGKTAALNWAAQLARSEILVFADANSIYEPAALRHLVANFAHPECGYVTGKMVYTNADGSISGDGCTSYMRYENRLRAWESQLGSVVGVDGGIDAVRRALYRPMRADQLPDFVLPLRVVEQGYRVCYEPAAILREPALASSSQEYRMRVRVTLRALWALWELRGLLNPLRYPLFSWQLASHKLLRYLAFIPQLLALLTSLALAPKGWIYALLLALQAVFYAAAFAGHLAARSGRGNRWLAAPYYLTLLNLACAHALWKFLRGTRQATWQPRGG